MKRQTKQPLLVQIMIAAIQLKLAFTCDSLDSGFATMSTFSGFGHSLLEICADGKEKLGVKDAQLYGFKVLKNENDRKTQTKYALFFFGTFNFMLYKLCS